MLDEEELGTYIDKHFTSTLFRLETLAHYDVGADGGDFRRYTAGEAGPDMNRKGRWMDHIRAEVARGLHTYRVHVVQGPLSDYLRFEFEWDYVYNTQAGESIRILDLAEQPRPPSLVDEDFWLIDDSCVIRMHYDSIGKYLGGELAADEAVAQYRLARDVAWSNAVPFPDYWREHPQYWRDPPAAR